MRMCYAVNGKFNVLGERLEQSGLLYCKKQGVMGNSIIQELIN